MEGQSRRPIKTRRGKRNHRIEISIIITITIRTTIMIITTTTTTRMPMRWTSIHIDTSTIIGHAFDYTSYHHPPFLYPVMEGNCRAMACLMGFPVSWSLINMHQCVHMSAAARSGSVVLPVTTHG